MLDVTVKTLDGKNRSFSVPDDILVRDFKLKIASSVEITADTQRLIFQGRVLQDDKKLNEYDVNGKTLHIVQRPPPLAPPGTAERSATAPPPSTTSFSNGGRRTVSGQVSTSANVVVGSVGIPHDVIDPTQIQNAVQQALTASGIVGPGQNVLVQTRVSGDGSSVDVRINLGPATIESESQNRLNMVRRMLDGATRILNRLENPEGAATNAAPMDTSPTGPSTSTGNPRDPSPMDTSTTPPPGGRAAQATTPPRGSTPGPSTTPPGGSAAPDGRPTASAGTGTQGRPQHPAPPALAEILSDVFDINRRLQPFLENYRDILQRDPAFTAEQSDEMRARQMEMDRVSEAIHFISHAYHSISDIMVNLAQPPPRQLRAGPVPIMPTLPTGAFMQHIAPQPPPRQLRAGPVPIMPTLPTGAFMQHIAPQAHLNVIRPNPIPASSAESASTAMPRSSTSDSPSNVSNSAASAAGVDSTTQTNGSRPPPATEGHPHPPPPPPPPMGMPTNGQPYVFMEVGPQSVSISSVTSHVVTDPPTQPTTQNTPPTATSNVPTSAQANTQQTNTTQSNQAGQPHPRAMPRIPNLSGIMGGMPSFMPPDLLQNIIHMATNAAARTHAGHAGHHVIIVTQEGDTSPTETVSTSTNSSTSSSSSSSSSTRPSPGGESATPSTSSTAAPSASTTNATAGANGREPHRATLLFPGPPGSHGMFRPPGADLVEPVDPFLQCHSRFFLGRRQPEPAHPPGQDGVGGMVTNLLSSVFSQHQHAHAHAMSHQHQHQHQQQQSGGAPPQGHAPPPPPPGPASNPFASLLQSIVRPPVPGAVPQRAPGPGAGPFRVQFQNMSQAPSSNSSSANQTPGTAPQHPHAPGPGSAVLSDEIFGQLVQGIGSHLSQAASGQQSTQTIADFLHNLGQGFNISSGEGMVSDLFMTVSRHLTFVDLMMVFFGNPQPLQALRAPLQQFLHDHVLHDNQPTVENIDQAVANILEDMRDEIAATAADVTPRDDIDFNMTLTRFIRQQLTITIRMIVNVPGDDQHFGRDLWERLRRVIHEFVVLSQYCLEGGTEAMERMVQSRLAVIASDVTPMTQQWMSSMTLQQLRQLLPSIAIGSDDIMHYVVRRTAESSEPTQTANVSVGVGSVAQQDNASQFNAEMNNIGSQTEQVMETEPQAEAVSVLVETDDDTLGEDLEKEEETRPPRPNIPQQVLDRLPPAPTKDSEEIAVVLGSEDWHRAVPSDWVPVITRDVRRQARGSHTPHQAGFSEAYIAGMPAKRRKMMNQEGGEGMHSNDSNTTNSASNTSTR